MTTTTTTTTTTAGLTHVERVLSAASATTSLAAIAQGTEYSRDIVATARSEYREFRQAMGYGGNAPLLTAPDAQPKLGKSAVPTYGLMLSPATAVNGLIIDGTYGADTFASEYGRKVNLCPMASKGCRAACLNTAGKGRLDSVQRARQVRTAFLLTNPHAALTLIVAEIVKALGKHGEIRVRLNVVSDIRWEIATPELFQAFYGPVSDGALAFYDYTAWSPDKRPDHGLPYGYSLTRSAKETHTDADILRMIDTGHNVAVPFAIRRGAPLPTVWQGVPVIDGDTSDDRTSDPLGVIVGLRAKGDAIGDTSGFVRKVGE